MRRRRVVALALLASVAIIVFACVIMASGHSSTPPVSESVLGAGRPVAHRSRDAVQLIRAQRRWGAVLDQAVRSGPDHGGEMEAAVMLSGWSRPIVRTTRHGATMQPMRAWSMSKALVAVSLLQELGWKTRPGHPPSPEVASARARALSRSENCRQRRVVLELQRASGGIAGARTAVGAVLKRAGVTCAGVATQTKGPDPVCDGYLSTVRGVRDPRAPTVLFGTSTWTIGAAARFAWALGSDAYGEATTRYVERLMRIPKQRSVEAALTDFTAPLNWGAGAAFAPENVAYKAGWGGSQQGAFLAGQTAVVHLPGGRVAGVAVVFHPHVQPPVDDPGLTQAPAAVTEAFSSIARATR